MHVCMRVCERTYALRLNGTILWAELNNARVGADVVHVELVAHDDGSKADKAKELYRRMVVSDGVQYLLGPYASSITKQAAAVAAELKHVMIASNAAAESTYRDGNEWLFGVVHTMSNAQTSIECDGL